MMLHCNVTCNKTKIERLLYTENGCKSAPDQCHPVAADVRHPRDRKQQGPKWELVHLVPAMFSDSVPFLMTGPDCPEV